MSVQLTWLTGPMVLATLLHLAVVGLVWRERPKAGSTWFAFDILSIATWSLGQVIVVSATTVGVAILGYNLSLLGFVFVVPTWLLFSLRYTGHPDRLSGWTAGLLAIEPVAVLALALTNADHELVYVDPVVNPAAGAQALGMDFGPVFWVHVAYALFLLGVGDWYMYRKFVGSRNVFRNRTFVILAASVVMTICFVASTGRFSPVPHHTLAPLVNLGTVVVGLAALLGYLSFSQLPIGRFLGRFAGRARSLTPLARNTAIEEMASGVVVADHENRIVDVNPIARRMLGGEDGRVVGKQVEAVLPRDLFVDGDVSYLDSHNTGTFSGIWVDSPDGERRCFDVQLTALTDDDGDLAGRVALINDVTERERREERLQERNRELERQNEQLEDFASMVSHDLRNPLNVASGRASLLADAVDEEHTEDVAAIEDALGRMDDLIDDVLLIARSGQTVDETAPLDLATIARDAWENVDTAAATLQVDGEATVRADRARLLRLFENLFRNAVEHGGDEVTVTVGPTEDGFFVADDGPGIDPENRETVFERGYSDAASGTGFGLAIVRTVAEAHGWEIAVTESETGGARFEVRGASVGESPAK